MTFHDVAATSDGGCEPPRVCDNFNRADFSLVLFYLTALVRITAF